MKLCSVQDLNSAPDDEFIKNCNTLFETAPVLSKLLLENRPFNSYLDLISFAERAINLSDLADKIEIVNAHPRIGAPTASLSSISRIEQGGADKNLEHILQRLKELNERYEQKFGFKFVVFVNGRSRSEIVPELEKRMNNSREHELKAGLEAMILIAKDRLLKYQ